MAASDPTLSANSATTSAIVVNKGDIGSNEFTGGRLSVLWQPTDKLEISASYLTQTIEQDGWGQEDLELDDAFSQRRFQVRQSPNSIGNEGFEDEIDIANLTVDYDLSWASVVSSTSWVDEDATKHVDLGFVFNFTVPWSQNVIYPGSVFSEELRLSSAFDGPSQFLLGMYYEDRDTGFEVQNYFGGTDSSLNTRNPGDFLLTHTALERSVTQRAIFGELYYDITEQVKLTFGGRAFKYDRENVDKRLFHYIAPPATSKLDGEDSDTSLKAGIEYTPDESTLVYATWAEGFRLGYPVPAANPAICDTNGDGLIDGSSVSAGPRSIDNDFVENYELGGKFSLLDNQLTLNAAVYHIDWEGIPIRQVFGPCVVAINAGKARSRGIEVETTYYWNENFQVNFSASYVNAELLTDVPQFNAVVGDRLPGSPRYNASLGLEYYFTLVDHDAYVRSDYVYVGGFSNNLQEIGTEAGDYGKLNFKTGVTFNQFDIQLYANNLTNEDSFTWIDAEGANPLAFDESGNRLRPRTIGLNIGYNF